VAKTSVSLGLGLLVAALAVAGVACGGAPGPVGDNTTIVTRAPDATLAAGSAQVVIDGPNAAASGVVDLGSGNSDLTLAVAPGYETAQLTSGRIRTVGDTVFFQAPAEKGHPNPAWQRDPTGMLPGLTSTGMRFGDPVAALDLLRGTQHILSDGGGEVRGASTARYTLDIDPAQAIETTPPARQAGLKALLGGRTDLFQVDVWIDGKDRVRRIEVPTDLTHKTPATRPDFLPIADTVDFATFGPPVSITAPTISAPN
jgi:hypothetical protein